MTAVLLTIFTIFLISCEREAPDHSLYKKEYEDPKTDKCKEDGLAYIYLTDPVESDFETGKVKLERLKNPKEGLSGEYADVYNCTKDHTSLPFLADMNGESVELKYCMEEKTAFPSSEGCWFQITPPIDKFHPEDPFAELMIYYHLDRAVGHFKAAHGFLPSKLPVKAVVNAEYLWGDLWWPLDNAYYSYPGGGGEIEAPHPEEVLVFGQGRWVDFSYDASVIYHEYTHLVVSFKRLQESFPDRYGVNNFSPALNEGYSDYFAASILDDPVVGRYALQVWTTGGGGQRILDGDKRCPDDLTGEIHADGEIFASAMWDIRKLLGSKAADDLFYDALQQYTIKTDFDGAVDIINSIARARFDEETAQKIDGIFASRGVKNCVRVKKFKEFDAGGEDRIPIAISGLKDWFGYYKDFVPAQFQFYTETSGGADNFQCKTKETTGRYNCAGEMIGTLDTRIIYRFGSPVEYRFFSGGLKYIEWTADGIENGEYINKREKLFKIPIPDDKKGQRLYFQFINPSYYSVYIEKIM